MTQPYTREQAAASKAVDAIRDKLAACARRWPDWEWENVPTYDRAGKIVARNMMARWSVRGREHGLQTPIPIVPSETDVAEAKDNIAHCALLNAEHRKAKAR